MIKKTGFTLPEVLITIILVGLLVGIGSSYIIKYVNKSKQNTYNIMVSDIEIAAKSYVDDNIYIIPSLTDNSYTITLNTLEQAGYLDFPITNPLTGEDLLGTETVLVTRTAGNFTYTFSLE